MKKPELRYFSERGDPGFKCSCNYSCDLGFNDMDEHFMHLLDEARHLAGVPFHITSGFRCPEHNDDVSSTGETGPHTTGKAVDIATPSSRDRFLILQALLKVGFNRVGIGETFIHADKSDNVPDVAWDYYG